MALGKDIEGGPAVVDLARMPHLLVAGTTGSGKSVAVNAMITSLLYHCSPEEVRMIMVDPKMLELSIYEGVPHLLLPVVTDPKKANLALRWAVEEMERRYDLLAQMGVRDIAGFNEKVAKQAAKLEADKLRAAADAAAAALEDDHREGGRRPIRRRRPTRARRSIAVTQHKLPYIVVVIDEFADLMMCAPKEVETSVARIAQKARAAGIHLILATQRPSVDVITGLIKANFPSRIAFHVTSKIDSRTILDQNGAEALLGAGDMLFSDRGGAPQRLHGCYVDEVEIHKVVDFLKTQGRPVYNLDIVKPREEDDEDGGEMQLPQRQERRRYVRQGRLHRDDHAQRVDLVGPAPAAHRLQPRRAARRGDGEAGRGVGSRPHEQARSADRSGLKKREVDLGRIAQCHRALALHALARRFFADRPWPRSASARIRARRRTLRRCTAPGTS